MTTEELLTRGVANVIPDKESLEKLLNSDKKLNIYFGIDPTSTKIHIGHAVPLRKLQQFAEMGHNVTFLIGDFTALIGDTSDKDSERPVLTYEQIEENFQTYKKQAEKILDFSKISVKRNSEWLSKLDFKEVVKLCQHFSFGEFASRELIRKRLDEGKKVALHEALYPVMQGYDSYFLDTDIQLGGTDQTFNMQAGRILQKDLRDKQSYVITNPFLEGTDGRKMSKSWGNAIWLEDEPNDMYGKIMSLRDDLIINYFTLGTNLTLEEIKAYEERLKNGDNPINIKRRLANQIVAEFHSKESADEAEKYFEKTFQDKKPEFSKEVPLSSNLTVAGTMSTVVGSVSEIKRLVNQGAVDVNGQTIDDPKMILQGGEEIKIGKTGFYKIKNK